ncbi:hypothetical protein DUI87_18076 [Hirundo rustica rustica]|uniref:Uncharacterized protein n=1 Tax=Hirundo rustica rustica TaxID=333673 RepID=A0A3M0JXL0_HIRRU|nr:hypothetical protein DUI87_18076 [Hirundo rustica rustica]
MLAIKSSLKNGIDFSQELISGWVNGLYGPDHACDYSLPSNAAEIVCEIQSGGKTTAFNSGMSLGLVLAFEVTLALDQGNLLCITQWWPEEKPELSNSSVKYYRSVLFFAFRVVEWHTGCLVRSGNDGYAAKMSICLACVANGAAVVAVVTADAD